MTPVTIETASTMCDVSTRTIRRWMSEGKIAKLFEDERGRTMLSLDDVLPYASMRMSEEDKGILEQADAGNAEALGDLGWMFFSLKRHVVARKFLEMAAKQGNADAMQALGRCYLSGDDQDENLAIMWIARAAASGHTIAKQQIRALLP
jgi:hypothetical protein